METYSAGTQPLRRAGEIVGQWLWIRGIFAVLFGIACLARPGAGLAVLVALFALYSFADGLIAGFAALKGDIKGAMRALLVLEAIVGIAAGILTFKHPGTAALAVLVIVALRAIMHGLSQVMIAVATNHLGYRAWPLGLAGLASIFFGVMIAARPAAGFLALAWLVGLYGLVVGMLQIAAAFRVAELRHARVNP